MLCLWRLFGEILCHFSFTEWVRPYKGWSSDDAWQICSSNVRKCCICSSFLCWPSGCTVCTVQKRWSGYRGNSSVSATNHKKGKVLLLPLPVSRRRSGKHRGIWLFCRKAPSSYQKVPFWKRSVVWIIIFFVLKPVNGKWIFVNILVNDARLRARVRVMRIIFFDIVIFQRFLVHVV